MSKVIFPFLLLFFALNLKMQANERQNIDFDTQNFYLNDPVKLKILTWNIFMLPKIAGNKGQFDRLPYIIEILKEDCYDVIVLQEVFINKIENKICKELEDEYPYTVRPIGGGFMKFNSGVLILSRYPIKKSKKILYKNHKYFDKLSNKGASFIEICKDGQVFQVVGTHTQSADSKTAQKIRFSQYKQIRNELLEPFDSTGVVQIVTGDLNTDLHQSDDYTLMLKILDVNDAFHHKDRKHFSWDGLINKFNFKWKSVRQNLDYVLYRSKDRCIVSKNSCQRFFRKKWNKSNDELSDHFAIETEIIVED